MSPSLADIGKSPEPPEVTEKQYYEALGRFVDGYSRTEGMARSLFLRISGVPLAINMAITGGMRMGDLIAPLKKVAEIQKMSVENRKELEKIFTHFNDITQFRHRLIHRGANLKAGKLISTNLLTVKAIEDYEEINFEVIDINNATDDLRMILLRLYWIMKPDALVPKDDPTRESVYGPWLYKPLKPDTPNRPPRAKRQSRKRRNVPSAD